MDFAWPYLLYFAIFSASFLLIFIINRLKSFRDVTFPPGQSGWLAGIKEAWQFYQHSKHGIPQKFMFDRMSKYSKDVFTTSLLGTNIVVLCGASGNKFMYSNDNKLFGMWWPSSLRKLVPETIKSALRSDPTTVRNLVSHFVKSESLECYVPVMDSMAKEHFGSAWLPYKTVKAGPLIKNFTFAVVCRLFFSIEDPEVVTRLEHPFHLVTAGLISMPVNLPGTTFSHAVKAAGIIHKEIISMVKQRKQESRACMDALDWMMIATDENGKTMSDKQIANKAVGFLLSSHDTTTTAITFLVKYLAENPHIYEKVFEEQIEIANAKSDGEFLSSNDVKRMKYSWCVACESLRMTPYSITTIREAKMDIRYAGFTIPKGWRTVYAPCSTHMNPEYYPNPEQFNPSRFEEDGPMPFTFTPFGGGPKMCPGIEFARIQILVFMHNLVTKFKLEKVNLLENTEYHIFPFPMPKDGLPIRLYPIKAEI